MKFFRKLGKYVRRFAWAFVVAYMIAWHNVYKERSDMPETIEWHIDEDQTIDNDEKL